MLEGLISALLFTGAAGLVTLFGVPVALAAARPHLWRPPPKSDRKRQERTEVVVRAFTPLDLGVDPVQWPSERPWISKSTIAEPAWPSMGWNDEHFGRQFREAQGKAPQAKAPQARAPQPKAPQAKAAQPSKAPEPRSGGVRRGAPPDDAEIEHLIGTVGLAGTVQAIMQRTGWEFREAAQHLARTRRDR